MKNIITFLVCLLAFGYCLWWASTYKDILLAIDLYAVVNKFPRQFLLNTLWMFLWITWAWRRLVKL